VGGGSGKFLRELKGHTDKIDTVAFSPDGKRLASGSQDNTVKLWDVATGKKIKSLKLKDNIYSVEQVANSLAEV
jgi:WD40 repeat protein